MLEVRLPGRLIVLFTNPPAGRYRQRFGCGAFVIFRRAVVVLRLRAPASVRHGRRSVVLYRPCVQCPGAGVLQCVLLA